MGATVPKSHARMGDGNGRKESWWRGLESMLVGGARMIPTCRQQRTWVGLGEEVAARAAVGVVAGRAGKVGRSAGKMASAATHNEQAAAAAWRTAFQPWRARFRRPQPPPALR
jgi:hypothetical protein